MFVHVRILQKWFCSCPFNLYASPQSAEYIRPNFFIGYCISHKQKLKPPCLGVGSTIYVVSGFFGGHPICRFLL